MSPARSTGSSCPPPWRFAPTIRSGCSPASACATPAGVSTTASLPTVRVSVGAARDRLRPADAQPATPNSPSTRCVNRRRRSGRSKPTCQATSAQCRQHGWSAHARPAYSFNQAKDELGWADYRLTDAHSIERWWELLTLCGAEAPQLLATGGGSQCRATGPLAYRIGVRRSACLAQPGRVRQRGGRESAPEAPATPAPAHTGRQTRTWHHDFWLTPRHA